MRFTVLSTISLAALACAQLQPNWTSPTGVSIYNPDDFFDTTGPWSLMSSAGDQLFVAGMRGIDPTTSTLVETGLPRVRQAYKNMKTLVEMMGTDVYSCLRLVVYVTDMNQYRPMCNQGQEEIWGNDPSKYPPRTIIQVTSLNQDDIVEVEGTFFVPHLNSKRDIHV